MAVRRLLVVGASLAGLRAVQGARDAGFDGTITLVGDEDRLPYDRTALSKDFLRAGDREVPDLHDASYYTGELGVDPVLGAPATALDAARRRVIAGGREFGFDALVIATGARARSLPGIPPLAGVHTLRSVADAREIRRELHAARHIVVIGAGFIGSEVASSARSLGREATVLDVDPAPLSGVLGKQMGALCAGLHPAHGTRLRCGVGVAGLAGHHRVEQVLLADGSSVPADLVVVGIGAAPATEWLAGSGVALGPDGAVRCDETMATGLPGVYAAGDLAEWPSPALGRRLRCEHWSTAAEQGLVAGRNAVTAGTAPCTAIPYFWSDWYGNRLQFAGVAGDEPAEVLGRPETGRFVALYEEAGRLTGVLAVNERGLFARHRARLRRQTTGMGVTGR